MIKGFTDSALLVYPFYEDYLDRSTHYRNKLKQSATILTDYLHKNDIKVDCFATDDVAHEMPVNPDRWALTLNKGDMFFVKNNCVGAEIESGDTREFDYIYVKTAARYPVERGLLGERRFELILKRDSMARRLVTGEYKLLIVVKQKKSPVIRYKVKKGSGVLYIEIDNVSFEAKCWMSDMEMDISEILGVKNAFMPVYEWEV